MSTVTNSVLKSDRPVLPEWTRWAWASMTEREYWNPIINNIDSKREFIEWLALIEGVRPAVFQYIDPEQLPQKILSASSFGLAAIPIDRVNKPLGYSSVATPWDPTQPWEYRVVFIKQERGKEIAKISNLSNNYKIDDDKLGEILGYPSCCRNSFLRTWGKNQVDSTWDQYAETGSADGPVEANMLWRWKNVRWVSHMPCSFQCQETVEIGKKTREVMRKYGLVEEIKAIDTILSWPTKWSGINGIAEIIGPCIKVSTRTDWAPPTDKRWFKRNGRYVKPTEDLWKHNGFSSYQGMIDSHTAIIPELNTFVPQNGAVIDLGCGNGRLLRTAKLHRPDIKISGVDTNIEAITSARSGLVGTWDASKIQELAWTKWFSPENTVLVYSPVRLTEMTADEREHTFEAMSRYKTHIVYLYGDNALKHPLEEWVSMAGFPVDRLIVTLSEKSNKNVSVGTLEL